MSGAAESNSLPTRPTLLRRLRAADDVEGWREFYGLYGPLIHHFACKAGLTADEAEEVVQETAIAVARNLPGFTYDPSTCRFKTWLLNLSRWRVIDRLRKRNTAKPLESALAVDLGGSVVSGSADQTGTAMIERIPDERIEAAGAGWDAAFNRRLFECAIEAVKQRVEPRLFQIFDLYVIKERPAREVAAALEIGIARVYLAKHRVEKMLRCELKRLQRWSPLGGPGSG